jgi:hypothetical protein
MGCVTMPPDLAAALAYWEGKRAGRLMPARRDLDPLLEIPRLLPWVMLTDVLRDPFDFRYRLIGSGVVNRSRRDFTGRRFSEMPQAGPDSRIWRDRAIVVESRTPKLGDPPYIGGREDVSGVRALHMPLATEDETTVAMIFTVVSYRTP